VSSASKPPDLSGPAADNGKVIDILIAEFNALRAEMLQKQSAQLTCLGLNLTALAAIAGYWKYRNKRIKLPQALLALIGARLP
jgi:hypothetical protein